MDIYTDYANWKTENYDFIYKLIKNRSKAIARFTSVIAVVDYLYDKITSDQKLSDDEEVIFSVGFDYIHDNFYTIKTLHDFTFDKNYEEMEKCAQTINLLLYINEFQAELLNSISNQNDIAQLDDLETKVLEYLDKKENCPDTFFPLLDSIVVPIFEKNELEFTPVESIFYEIAIEYGIYKENETDIYNSFIKYKKDLKK